MWSRSRARRLCIVLATSLIPVTALTVVSSAPAEAASPPGFVTMFSTAGDYIGAGGAYNFDSPADSIGAQFGGGSTLSVSVDAANGSWFYYNFDAPSNQKLTVGTYYDAQRYPFNDGYHPGISVYGDGRGCNQDFGYFTVHDIAWSQQTVTRLDLTFVQYCEGWSAPPLFGHISIGDPATGTSVSPTRVEWPLQLPNAPSRNVPITVRAGSTDVSVGVVTLTPGLDPEGAGTAFKITNNTCPATLTAGSTCVITTSFNPLGAGAYTANLFIGGSGVAHVVKLSGLTTDGFTGWQQATVAPDESSTDKISLTPFTPATFDATADAGSLTLQGHSGADDLSITVAPPAGQQLTDGATYTGAVPTPGAGSGLAQLSLSVNGQSCPTSTGSFAVQNIQVDPGTGAIQRASITFKRTCSLDRAAPAQVGSVGFNALRGPRTVPSFGELDGVQGTVVTTQVSPQRTDFGSSVSVSGRLATPGENGLKGKRVYLWQKRADSGVWDKVARTRTGFDGGFSFTRFAARNVSYRTDFGGTDYLLPSTSQPVPLKVQRNVVAALSASSISVNTPVSLFGHIEVREAGVGMEVQRENRQGKWATIATETTGGRGQFAFDLTFDRRKVVYLRVRSAATLVCERGESSSLSLTVD